MLIKNFFYIIFFFPVISLSAEGGSNLIVLHYPPDMTVMELGRLGISLSVPQNVVDLIEIRVNETKHVSTPPLRKTDCFSVPIKLGISKVDIVAKKEGRILEQVSFRVFRRSDLVSKYDQPPAGFRKDYFHMKARLECTGCHSLEPKEADKKTINMTTFTAEPSPKASPAARTSTCYSCHGSITSDPFVHGPVSVWSCLSCHNPDVEPKYFINNPNEEVCFDCHGNQEKTWSNKKYFHAPFATGKCAICHNSHASENPFILVKPTWILCLTCHTDKGSGRHIIAGYLPGDRHPTHGVKDPLRQGRELTCASCHDPHTSDSSKFSTLGPGGGFILCKKCHIDLRFQGAAGAPLPRSPSIQ